MILYIRHKPRKWINFVSNLEELKTFVDAFIPGRPILLGDLSQFNKYMLNLLLKFIEENPEVDCYSSSDVDDPILLSRFVQVIKEPMVINSMMSSEEFQQSNKDYVAVESAYPNVPQDLKLRIVKSLPAFTTMLSQL